MSTSGFYPWLEFGDIRIQSYFFVVSLVLCLCAIWIPKRAEACGLPPTRALDLFITAMVGGFLGSRLLHILWEEPKYYLENPLLVFDVMAGGFVWYGGAIGAALSIFIFLKVKRDTGFWIWMDFFAPITAIGYAGGRIACLLTGCCFGRVCELQGRLFHFPTQGFAVLWELAVGAGLLWLEKRRRHVFGFSFKSNGQIFSLWLVLHGLGRIIMESLRADPRGPSVWFFTISMTLSLALIGAGILIYIKRPGST